MRITIQKPNLRLATVALRDVTHNYVVTNIEILLSINKREPNLSHYRQKRQRLREAHVHLLNAFNVDLPDELTEPILPV